MKKVFAVAATAAAIIVLAAWFRTSGRTCPVEIAKRTVSGSSLEGVLNSGDEVWIEMGYYACRPVKRGDIVAYHYGGNERPIVKIVRGIPGDAFALEPAERGGTYLLVNNGRLQDDAGTFYILDAHQARIIGLYVRDYHGVIPADSYLLLGSASAASLDSRQFGLAAKMDILGRVRR